MWSIITFIVEILSYFFKRFKKKEAQDEAADQALAENIAKQRATVSGRVLNAEDQLDMMRKVFSDTEKADLEAIKNAGKIQGSATGNN